LPKISERLIQQIVLAIVAVALSIFTFLKFIEVNQVYQLDFAAGDARSESYVLSKAIAQVILTNQPRIQLKVIPTGGTVENISLLEAKKVQLATGWALPTTRVSQYLDIQNDCADLLSCSLVHFRTCRIKLVSPMV
jgi:hypothetical protein